VGYPGITQVFVSDDAFVSQNNLQKSVNSLDSKKRSLKIQKTPPTLENVRYVDVPQKEEEAIYKRKPIISPKVKKPVPEAVREKLKKKSDGIKGNSNSLLIKDKIPVTNTKIVRKKNKNRLKSMINNRKEEKQKMMDEIR